MSPELMSPVLSFDQIGFAPLLPPAALAVLAVACLVPLGVAAWRRARGAGLRAAACLIALAFLADPRWIVRTGTQLPGIVLLAVDQSGSMQVDDRARLAEQAARSLAAQAARRTDLRLRRIDVTDSGGNDSGAGGTRLFAAIDAALAEIPPAQRAGVIALTDGAVTDAPNAFAPPLHVLIPAAGEQTDRRLRVTRAPGYGIVGQTVRLGFVVEDLGGPAGGVAHLRWTQDGAPGGEADVTVGAPASIDVPISREGGTTIALDVDALPNEASLLNNRVALTVNGVRDRLRVLLISGEPHAGERTWRRLLRSDPAVDLVHFTILRPPGKDDLTPLNQLALITFPIRELFVEKIRQFDLIILDRFNSAGLLPQAYLQNIADYVRAGGALLVSAGPEYASAASIANGPIGDVLPAFARAQDSVVTGPFKPVVTPLGERHPVTENLPGDRPGGTPSWGDWYRSIATGPDPRGDVVLRAGPGGAPLLVLDRVGDGRVALLLSDQIWLWSRGHEGGGPQAELLRRIAHWLMKEPELDENALTARIDQGRLVVERHALTAADPATRLVVTDPAGRQTSAALTDTNGRAMASLPAGVPGLWRVQYGAQDAYAAAAPADPEEMADLRATATRVRPIARSVHWLLPGGAPPLDRLALAAPHALRLTGLRSVPLFSAWLALPLFLLTLLFAWRREGR
jgi:hypothetical protein